jgi:uncharacterized protein with HEPN domain
MARKVSHVLHDMLEAIERIEQITRGKTFADFERSWELRWLVQRAIQIISEASRAIPDQLTSARPEIPWSRVRGIGNVLRHDYASISDPIIWKVVTDELPPLKKAIEAINNQLDESPS